MRFAFFLLLKVIKHILLRDIFKDYGGFLFFHFHKIFCFHLEE